MDKEYNPFTDCNVVATDQGWSVASMYWTIPAQNEGVANRIAELIQHAYKAGREDNQKSIKQVLGINDELY